ncbi:MAG: sensor domain-containing diguanylate cyclase [Cyanobacteria bacterium J06633_2]
MAFETRQWKTVLSGLRGAIAQAETVDMLIRKAVTIVDAAFHVNSIVWVYSDSSENEPWRAYGTTSSWTMLQIEDRFRQDRDAMSAPVMEKSNLQGDRPLTPPRKVEPVEVIRRFRPTVIPDWLIQQQHHPQPAILDSGDLVIPVIDDASAPRSAVNISMPQSEPSDDFSQDQFSNSFSGQSIRFVFQVSSSFSSSQEANASPATFSNSEQANDAEVTDWPGWTEKVLSRLQAIGDHLLLACDALIFKRRLEQSQRHVSLLSRTSHILNTSIHPDRAIQQILAEMGQRLKSDRIALFDLRNQAAALITHWDRPRQPLKPFTREISDYTLWHDTIDVFLQGGASYLELQLADTNDDTQPDDDPLCTWFRNAGIGSALVLPLFIREEFFGAIALLSHRPNRRYVLDELQMAQQSTDQLAIAFTIIQHTQSSALVPVPASIQQTVANQSQLFIDSLTRLPNREALERELDTLSKTSVWAFRAPFSLIICDIDYFKLVNDNHGYHLGDRILLRVAQQLQHQLRRTTSIYRYSGEEFVIILEQTDLQVASDVAERLRQSIRAMPLRTEKEVLSITASFGVSQLIPSLDHHALDVLKRAEEALFEAKRDGRDRVSTQRSDRVTST